MNCVPVFLAALLLTSVAQAGIIVVDPAVPGANDQNAGTAVQPLATIGRAAELVQPGDVVQIHAGIYREKVTIPRSGTEELPIRFEAVPGDLVVVTGVDPLTAWSKEPDGTYSIPWTHRLFQGDKNNPGGSEQVFVAGTLLRKVSSLNELTEGAFFVDEQAGRLHLHADRDPESTTVASTRSEVWIVNGAHVHTRGLRFYAAANRAQQAMAQFRGQHDVVEDCAFEWSNSTGASFQAEDIVVRHCLFEDNGQQGFTANKAHRLLFDGCTVQRNNIKDYPRGWEAGGNKLCFCRGATLQNSRFLRNRGNGVWFDIGNEEATIRNCLIADNEDAGIFYEISYGLQAHDNVIVGNGLAGTKGAWGANGGICVSSSPGCVIEHNLIAGNAQGFCFREQNRTTPRIDGSQDRNVPVWNHDEVIRDNLIVNNRTAQVQGWFDIATERQWPKAMQSGKAEGGKAGEDLAAEYKAREGGVPAGLSLEDLKIAFQGNIYALQPGQPFFIWGTDWKRKQAFKDFPGLSQALGFEDERSRILPAFPVEFAKRDFRLPAELLKAVSTAYPRGKVPDCELGLAAAGIPRQ